MLPHAPPSRRDQGSGARRPVTGARRRHAVLLVDDDVDTLELYAWSLRAAGWHVEAVPNVAEALFLAADFAPDVIVMDLRLPVIDGVEAARWLKADPRTTHIPIVAISGIDRQRGEALATEAGCEAFVAKPCVPEELRGLLESLVREA
jgi:two-component system cell cycle response regulator DivK